MSALWPMVRLVDVVRHRKQFVQIDDLTEYKRCRVQLHAQGVVLRDRVPGAEIKTKTQQVCRAGDFLVAEIDAKMGGFGIVPEALGGAIVSSHYFLFEVDERKLDRAFIGWYCKTPAFREQVNAQGTTNYAAIRPAHVLNYSIPLPPLAEQQRIVARLGTLAERMLEAERLADLADAEASVCYARIRDTIYRNLSCDRSPMADALELINGRAFRPDEWGTNGRRIIRIQNLKYPEAPFNRYDGSVQSKHLVQSGDVLFAWSGQIVSLGAHLWSGEEAILNQHIFRVVPRFEMLARFVQEGLNALVDEMANQVRGLEMFHIRKQELDRMLFPVPSLDVQRRVVHQLDAYRDLCHRVRTEQESRSRRVRSLAPSVLNRVFAGGL